MTKEKLQDRISKKEQDIQKIEKRIAKWAKGLRPEDIAICESFGNCFYGDKPRDVHWSNFHGTELFQETYRKYKEYIDTHNDIPSSDDWNKGPNMHELYSAYRDLGEARHTLEKYTEELNKLVNFENEEKIEVIWNFLMQWKELAREWYHRNAEKYFELKKGYKKAHQEMLDEYDGKPAYYTERNWEKNYYFSIDSLTKEITNIKHEYFYPNPECRWEYEYLPVSYTIDEEMLEKALAKEVKAKYTRLINDITAITGEITDAKGLNISHAGDINGIVIGKLGTAQVLTFGAGGWNIQCFHFRTKITRVK